MSPSNSAFAERYGPLKSQVGDGLALDIDETIAGTNAYWASLLFGSHGHPRFASAADVMRAYKFVRDVPEWREAAIQEHALALIGTPNVALAIPPVAGAQVGVAELEKVRPVSCYVTGRPRVLEEATHWWLSKHAFPAAPVVFQASEAELVAWGIQSPEEWRIELLEFLHPRVAGIIDDNVHLPAHARQYRGAIFTIGQAGWPSVVRDVVAYFQSSAGGTRGRSR